MKCRVTPKAAKTATIGWEGDVLRVRIAAVPEKGAANKALMRHLAKIFDIAPSSIALVSGASSRDKVIRIEGISLAVMKKMLSTCS